MGALLMVVMLTQAPERVPLPAKTQAATSRDDDWAREHEQMLKTAKETKEEDAQRFVRTPPSELQRWPDGATNRFLGALLGGALGMALPGVLAAASRTPCGAFVACVPGPVAVLLSSLTPPVAIVGAMLGSTLMGGQPSFGAAVAGLMGGLTSGLLLLLYHSRAFTGSSGDSAVGVTLAASGLAVALMAIALEARSDALEEFPFIATPTSRLVATALGTLGALAGVALLTTIAITAGGNGAAAAVVSILGLGALPLVPWAIHGGNGGRGSIGAAYLGWLGAVALVGLCAGLVAVGLTGSLGGPTPPVIAMLGGGIALGTLASVFAVPLILEWSHGQALIEESVKTSVKAQVSVAPVSGPTGITGGAVALSGTF